MQRESRASTKYHPMQAGAPRNRAHSNRIAESISHLFHQHSRSMDHTFDPLPPCLRLSPLHSHNRSARNVYEKMEGSFVRMSRRTPKKSPRSKLGWFSLRFLPCYLKMFKDPLSLSANKKAYPWGTEVSSLKPFRLFRRGRCSQHRPLDFIYKNLMHWSIRFS